MSRIEKLIQKFKGDPASVKYRDLIKILEYYGFVKIATKGSHHKFKNTLTSTDYVIPVHNNECKVFYKKEILKIIKKQK